MNMVESMEGEVTRIIRTLGYTRREVLTSHTDTYVHVWAGKGLGSRQAAAKTLWSIRHVLTRGLPEALVVVESIGLGVVSVVVDAAGHAEYEEVRSRRRAADARVSRTIARREITSRVGRGTPLGFETHPRTGEVLVRVEPEDEASVRRALTSCGLIGRSGQRDRVVVSSGPHVQLRSLAQWRHDTLVEAGVVGERLELPVAA